MAPATLPPGFRFHPTDEELVAYYLKRKINGHNIELEIIPEVDLYKCEPWDLPEKSFLPSKELEWYFFSPRDRKYPNGSRTNRATKAGYWKATGKDRRVNSHMRVVGTKKTLVYYGGRAPHGARTNWVMHEYRLDERECETDSGLQDAYALCRIIKKNAIVTKIGNQYTTNHNQLTTSDHSSTMELSTEGRSEDLENSNYTFPLETYPPDIVQGSSFDINAQRDEKWMQYLSDEACSFTNPAFTCEITAYPPSKVGIALECARLKHQLSLPPLEVQEFPQVGFTDSKLPESRCYRYNTNEPDVLQEILSFSSATQYQELISQSNVQDTWARIYACPDKFASASSDTQRCWMNDNGSLGCKEKSLGVKQTRFIEIGNLEDEFKTERTVENLQGVGMLNKYLEKTLLEEQNIIPVKSILNLQSEKYHENKGETSHNNFEEFDKEINDLPLGFISDNQNVIFSEDGDMDDLSNTPSFEFCEKVEVNQGMFVSSNQVAETFFHQIEHSRTIEVHVNPSMTYNFQIGKGRIPERVNSSSFLCNFKAFVQHMLVGITKSMKTRRSSLLKETMTIITHIVSLLFAYCIYIAEHSENVRLGDDITATCEDMSKRGEDDCSSEVKKMKKLGRTKWNNMKNKVWFANMRGGHISNALLNKKWPFFTIALAFYAFGVHHIIPFS